MRTTRDTTGAHYARYVRKWTSLVRRSRRLEGRFAPRCAVLATGKRQATPGMRGYAGVDFGRAMRGLVSPVAARAAAVKRGDRVAWYKGERALRGGAEATAHERVVRSVVARFAGSGRWRERGADAGPGLARSMRGRWQLAGMFRSGSGWTMREGMPAIRMPMGRSVSGLLPGVKRYRWEDFGARAGTDAGLRSGRTGGFGQGRRAVGGGWRSVRGQPASGRAFAPVGRSRGMFAEGAAEYRAPYAGTDRMKERYPRDGDWHKGADDPHRAGRTGWSRAGHAVDAASGAMKVPAAVAPPDMMRIIGELFGDEARRPPSGVTGFDARMSPIFAGRKPGF